MSQKVFSYISGLPILAGTPAYGRYFRNDIAKNNFPPLLIFLSTASLHSSYSPTLLFSSSPSLLSSPSSLAPLLSSSLPSSPLPLLLLLLLPYLFSPPPVLRINLLLTNNQSALAVKLLLKSFVSRTKKWSQKKRTEIYTYMTFH